VSGSLAIGAGSSTISGAVIVNTGATLSVGPAATLLLTDGQTITDNGTLTFASGDVMDFNTYYGASQIVINGTMTATGDAFATTSGSGGSIQVKAGGNLDANGSTFALNNLVLSAGSNAQLAVDSIANEFSINSGATINITGNNFTNISNNTNQNIVASGDSTATINLANNYWGTTNATQIAAKITDHSDNSSLPTVNYNPPLADVSPAPLVSLTTPANVSTTFSSSSQKIGLSASVTSGVTNVNEGNEMFVVLSGINEVSPPVTVNVVNGVASTTSYTLPPATTAGTYTIEAIYYGTGNYLGFIDSSHTLTINAAATTTSAKSASTTYSAVSQSVPLSAAITSTKEASHGKLARRSGTGLPKSNRLAIRARQRATNSDDATLRDLALARIEAERRA
jgi:hypothetical protein